MAKIYTKTGDQGTTALLGGSRVMKSDERIEAYGTLDELNSLLGIVRAVLLRHRESAKSPEAIGKVDADLEKIQNLLFDLGSLLATLPEDRRHFNLQAIELEHIEWLEKEIDAMSFVLKPLKNFILPGGSEGSAFVHLARTVTRRAERSMLRCGEHLPAHAVAWINRLSDYFFMLARYVNHLLGVEDKLWEKRADQGEQTKQEHESPYKVNLGSSKNDEVFGGSQFYFDHGFVSLRNMTKEIKFIDLHFNRQLWPFEGSFEWNAYRISSALNQRLTSPLNVVGKNIKLNDIVRIYVDAGDDVLIEFVPAEQESSK